MLRVFVLLPPVDYFLYIILEVYHGKSVNLGTKIMKMAQRRHEQVIWKAIHSWLNNEQIHKIRTVQEHDSARLQAIFWMKNVMSISLNLQKDGFVKEICLLLINVTDPWLTGCSKEFIIYDCGQRGILSVIQKVLYFFLMETYRREMNQRKSRAVRFLNTRQLEFS